jgi:hypothetical protein
MDVFHVKFVHFMLKKKSSVSHKAVDDMSASFNLQNTSKKLKKSLKVTNNREKFFELGDHFKVKSRKWHFFIFSDFFFRKCVQISLYYFL